VSVRGLAAALAAGVVTNRARGALAEYAPGGQERWQRSNHRGELVSLLEGPAVAAGLLGGLAAGTPARTGIATAVAVGSGAAFGVLDDLAEDTSRRVKGLRGHLGALADGDLTTGTIKILGIGGGALLAALVGTRSRGRQKLVDLAVNTALVAASANLLNLLDLRPGRALKAALAGAAALAPLEPGTAGAVAGASAAAIGEDLAEHDMLGDGGANALGAALGAGLAFSASRRTRLTALAAIVALTLASEKVSFSEVIARTPGLRELDALGRRR